MSQSRWMPLGGGRQLKLACHGGSWSWADWRIQRGLPPVVEVVTLPPPPAEEASRQFALPEEAAAFFAARGAVAIASSSREARAQPG
jgi:hypothetical protein